MKWVTRRGAKVDRIACPWLIRRFIDPQAEFLFVPPEAVLQTAKAQGAVSFDAPGADYTHHGGACTFEVLLEAFDLQDPVLHRLARIVHGADIAADPDATPQSAGLKAVAEGFALVCPDDQRKLVLETPIYDALYAWCAAQEGQGSEAS